jgi:hypothetical protein
VIGLFARHQPEYARHGIAVFPCDTTTKKPLVRNYLHIGNGGAAQLARKFTYANAFGFAPGKRNRITVLDIDTTDTRVLDEVVARHGKPRVVVQTASGGYHCYYRHNGERRLIRPFGADIQIDILGESGFVMAPPSQLNGGRYQIIKGNLADLDRLAPMKGADTLKSRPTTTTGCIREGKRNEALWRHCMKQARCCDAVDDLLDVARTFNEMQLEPPLADTEVIKASRSAWDYEQAGKNQFGRHGSYLPSDIVQQLATRNTDALALLSVLKAHNGPNNTFPIANAMAGNLIALRRHRFAKARKEIISLGLVRQVRSNGRRQAALYRWPTKSAEIEQ